ncbi:MAG: hypothetical protein ACXVCP_15955, partial [Bdellovibrio sp.]
APKHTLSVAVATYLLLTPITPFAQEQTLAKKGAETAKSILQRDILEFSSISLQWENAKPVRILRIPLLSAQTIAANYLAGKIPFVGASSTKGSIIQIRKVVTKEEAERITTPDWNPEAEIQANMHKNPFVDENALNNLEIGEELRFEMNTGKSIGAKYGVGPAGASTSISDGQKIVFILRKLSEHQAQLDVTRMTQFTKGARASVGPGFAFLADSDAAIEKNINFRDFYSNVYMSVVQNVKSKGVTDSYVLDLNSPQEINFFKNGIIKRVTKKSGEAVKTADDLRRIDESFMQDLEEEAQQLNEDLHQGRSYIQSETDSLNRNAGLNSVLGKFLYSFKFSRNFVMVEKPEDGNKSVMQFYQTEAGIVGAKRSFWSDKNGRTSKMGITFSTKGDYANPQIDKLLELSINSSRYTYAKKNDDQIRQWQESLIDILPESLFNQVFSGDWKPGTEKSLIDPRVNISIFFNRDYLLDISTKASQHPGGAKVYFGKMIEDYIDNANNKNLESAKKRNKYLEMAHQFLLERFGRENSGPIDTKSNGVKKQINETANILAQVVDANTLPLKRIEAFESLRKVSLFKRLSTGFLLSLIEPQDFQKFVSIEVNRSYDEVFENEGGKKIEHRFEAFKAGAERDPDIKAINGLINRAKGSGGSLPELQNQGKPQLQKNTCEEAFAS